MRGRGRLHLNVARTLAVCQHALAWRWARLKHSRIFQFLHYSLHTQIRPYNLEEQYLSFPTRISSRSHTVAPKTKLSLRAHCVGNSLTANFNYLAQNLCEAAMRPKPDRTCNIIE